MAISYFNMCYRAVVIKPILHWHRNRHENEWNKREDPNMSIYNLYLTNSAGKIECQHVELDP